MEISDRSSKTEKVVVAPSGKRRRTFVGHIWERQPDESPDAWEAFLVYRNLGYSRGLRAVAEQLGYSLSKVQAISRRWVWVRRIEEWDLFLDREYRAEMLAHRRAMARKHVKMAEKIQSVAFSALTKKYGSNLELLTAESFDNDQMLRWLCESTKMERTAVGSPSEIIEEQVTGGVTESDRIPVALPATTDERLAAALVILDAARARTGALTAGTADRLAILPAQTLGEAAAVPRD